MGYEVTLTYHPRKDDGAGYDTEVREEKILKIGKPFDDTPLEKLAAGVMSQMARRDIWVVDVRAVELVRREVTFKECKDGKGIILKNRKFTFNESAQMVAEDIGQPDPTPQVCHAPQNIEVFDDTPPNVIIPCQPLPQGLHPHEMLAANRQRTNIDDLYGNPNKPVPVVKQGNTQPRAKIDPKKILYHVYFEPYFYEAEAKRLGLRFTADRKYPVHQIIPDPQGRLDNQKLAVTDDVGRVVEVDEKYFSSAGLGLMADQQLHFSGANGRGARKPKLAFENEMYIDAPDPKMAGMAIPQGIPVDDGSIPDELLNMPDIRSVRKIR